MSGLSDKRVSSWFFELSESLTAGFSPAESVGMADGIPKKIGISLSQRFEEGSSWTAAFDAQCPFLQVGERSIIAAAELSGKLPAVFKELGEVRKEAASFQNRIKLASLYPIVILHFAALLFPLEYVIDGKFEAYLVSVGMILVPLWVLLALLSIAFKFSRRFKKGLQSLLPIIKSYSINRDLARFCRTFAACVRSGVSVESCWQWALDAADSSRLEKEGKLAIRTIKAGRLASEGFVDKGGFPPELKQQYRIGERTGSLDVNIERMAEMYSSVAKKRIFLATLVYPQILFLVIAVFVAIKVISFYKGYFDGVLDILE